MRFGFLSIFYFTVIYLLVQSGYLVLPEPFQSIIQTYGFYFIYVSIGITAIPILLTSLALLADRDRDIARSETWEEESSNVSAIINNHNHR